MAAEVVAVGDFCQALAAESGAEVEVTELVEEDKEVLLF